METVAEYFMKRRPVRMPNADDEGDDDGSIDDAMDQSHARTLGSLMRKAKSKGLVDSIKLSVWERK